MGRKKMMSGPYLYTVEIDAEPRDLERIIAWNINRHAPDMYKSGFQTTATYLSVRGNSPDFINLYEVDRPDCWTSAPYTARMARDPYSKEVMALRRNVQQTLYLQESKGSASADTPAIDADYVYLLWFEPRVGVEDAIGDWLAGEAWPCLAALGAHGLRVARRTANRPGANSHRPGHLVVVEWPVRPDIVADILPSLAKRFGAEVSDASDYVGRRIFPWPDNRLS